MGMRDAEEVVVWLRHPVRLWQKYDGQIWLELFLEIGKSW